MGNQPENEASHFLASNVEVNVLNCVSTLASGTVLKYFSFCYQQRLSRDEGVFIH